MPGAGSLKAANYLFNVAPKDGSAFGMFSRGMAMEPLIGGAGAQFDATEVHLARQRHQRGQRVRHLARRRRSKTWADMLAQAVHASAAKAPAPIPTSTRCC